MPDDGRSKSAPTGARWCCSSAALTVDEQRQVATTRKHKRERRQRKQGASEQLEEEEAEAELEEDLGAEAEELTAWAEQEQPGAGAGRQSKRARRCTWQGGHGLFLAGRKADRRVASCVRGAGCSFVS